MPLKIHARIPSITLSRARGMRRTPTPAEGLLWKHLRNRASGFKFRRQHPSPPFILDFYCDEAKLCIEIDSDIHTGQAAVARDEERSRQLAERGIRVLRFSTRDVLTNADGVIQVILEACRSSGATPSAKPSP